MFTAIKILSFLLFSSSAAAVIDVSGATGGITDGVTAVVDVLSALLVAYSIYLGFKLPINYLRYGNFSGVEQGDEHYYRDESGEWVWGVELDEDDGEYDWGGDDDYNAETEKQFIVSQYWSSKECSGVDNLDIYQWGEKYDIDTSDIEDYDWL